ncbi:hypothetical protein D9M71_101100 [compost metagenome]
MQGEVPRADDADHAQRGAIHTALLARDVRGDDTAVHAAWQAGRLQGDGARRPPFDLCLDSGAARLADDPVDDLLSALIENFHRVEHHLGAFGGRLGRPFRLGVTRLAVTGVEILAIGQGDFQQAPLGEGVEHFQRSTGGADTPLSGERLQLQVLVGRANSAHEVLSCLIGRLRGRSRAAGQRTFDSDPGMQSPRLRLDADASNPGDELQHRISTTLLVWLACSREE